MPLRTRTARSRRTRATYPLLGYLALLCACPSEQESFDLALLLVQEADCSKGAATQTRLAQGQHSVRVTFMRRPEGTPVGPATLRDFSMICDQVVPPKEDAEFVVDTKGGGPIVSVLVEVFDSANQLVLFGANYALDIWQSKGTVFLRPAGQPSCTEPARRLHAFHSATLLPNGQVLAVGGLAADTTGGDNLANKDQAYANGAVELYDPMTLQFVVPTPATIPGRAFHRAILLPSPAEGPYKVLLLGGIAAADEASPLLRLRVETTAVPFLLSPHETAKAAEAALLTVKPDPEQPTLQYEPLPNLPTGMFAEVALSADDAQALFIPGASRYEATASAATGFFSEGPAQAQWIQLSDPPVVGAAVAMGNVRVGHSAARLGADRFVVLGGAMDGLPDSEPDNLAVAAALGDAAFANVSPRVDHAVAWHTLTPIGSADSELADSPPVTALWAGGYKLRRETDNLRQANDFGDLPPQRSLQLVRDGAPLAISDASAAGGYALSGYHDALRLHDGRVMISGGNDYPKSAFTALRQLAIYRLVGQELELDPASSAEGLRVGRFGHRSTRLLDNTVLITGGITLTNEATPLITNETELFNLRFGDASEDYPFGRAPAAAKTACRPYGAPAQRSAAMTIATSPSPWTISGQRPAQVAGPTRRVRLRIAAGAPAR